LAGGEYVAIGARIRFLVFKRDNFTCQYCGNKPPDVRLQVDHIIAKSKGGKDEIENFLTACSTCNLGKMVSDVIEPDPHHHDSEKCEECCKIADAASSTGWFDAACAFQRGVWENLDYILPSPDTVAKHLRFKEVVFKIAFSGGRCPKE